MKLVAAETQQQLVRLYKQGVRGSGYKSLAKQFGLNFSTVRNIILRARNCPTSYVKPRGHRKKILTNAELRRITTSLEENPTATNEELARKVNNKIASRTVSDYLKREIVPFRRKKLIDINPEEFTAEWRENAREFTREVKKIPYRNRVYQDETAIFDNEAPRYGRVRKGVQKIRRRKRYGYKRTLHIWAKRNEVLHWELREVNANDNECRLVGMRAIKKIQTCDTLIWDRLGKSGRSVNPTAQHYNPTLLRELEKRGINVMYLPPKGKYWNPIELLINDLKSHYIRPSHKNRENGFSRKMLLDMIKRYMTDIAPNVLPGFFQKRANGNHAIELGLL